jgi:brefeldin A-inhibited guanine nucleotide-exchange protein
MATAAETQDVEETLEEVSLHDTPRPEYGSKPSNGVASSGPKVPNFSPPILSTPSSAQPQTPTRPLPLNLNGHNNTHTSTPLQSPPPRISTSNSTAPSVLPTRTSTVGFLTLPQGQTLSIVLITSALDIIIQSKEAKRSQHLREATEHALAMVRQGQGADKPKEIFEPLRLACETRNDKLQIASLDCIAKLTAYAFFVEATPNANAYASPPGSPSASATNLPASLADTVAHTITNCYTESTLDTVSLQIVKALLALVLSPHILVHHSSLLKAVRTVYNIFLLSQDPVNQNIAQGGLTQMVHHIFARCQIPTDPTGPADIPTTTSRSSLAPSNEAQEGPSTPASKGNSNGIHQFGSSTSVDSDLAVAAAVPLPPEGDDENLDSEYVYFALLYALSNGTPCLGLRTPQVYPTREGTLRLENPMHSARMICSSRMRSSYSVLFAS